ECKTFALLVTPALVTYSRARNSPMNNRRQRWVLATLLSLAGAFGSMAMAADQQSRLQYDRQCVTIDGHDLVLFSGAFHYFRCPKALWADRFQRLKEAGFNTVETYAAWNWHEPNPPAGPDDFSKLDMSD